MPVISLSPSLPATSGPPAESSVADGSRPSAMKRTGAGAAGFE